MFDFNDVSHSFQEIEDEALQLDNFYIPHRKSSFVDLLSGNKISCETLDLNLDELLDGSTSNELIEIKQDHQTVTLLIDNFPDVVLASPKLSLNEKVHQKTQIKVKTQSVGTLSAFDRQKKIERYLEKKRKRTWVKKIHYDCRKKVADNRLRIKGRFVNRNKAFDIITQGGNQLESNNKINPS